MSNGANSPEQSSPLDQANDQRQTIDTTRKTILDLVYWVRDGFLLVRKKGNWTLKLASLLAIALVLLNPASIKPIAAFFDFTVPASYPTYFWIAIGLLFVLAVVAAILEVKPDPEPNISLADSSPIKGLSSFEVRDHQIFLQLQRTNDIRQLAQAIVHDSFRFGVLIGESGCGKSSLLAAGVRPVLEEQAFICLIVKMSNEAPEASLQNMLVAQFPPEESQENILSLLQASVETAQAQEKQLVLILDQFEQFFTQHRNALVDSPLAQALREWYQQYPDWPLKILLSIRTDFQGYLYDLEATIGYQLAAGQNYYKLEKFTPDQAVAIFKVLAESENIVYNEDFLRTLCSRELADPKTNRILAVDIQVIAQIIQSQGKDGWSFTEGSFQKLGGVSGLLQRYLKEQLDTPSRVNQQQAALKVLLALIDTENLVRSGALSQTEIQQKLAASVDRSLVPLALDWLMKRRLVKTADGKPPRYELAHERLISPIQAVAGDVKEPAYIVNELLNQRVNQWLGGNRHRRYLLNGSELRKIKRYDTFISWEPREKDKRQLIYQSRQAQGVRISIAAVVLLMLLGVVFYTQTIGGKLWQLHRQYEKLVVQLPADQQEIYLTYLLSDTVVMTNSALYNPFAESFAFRIIDTLVSRMAKLPPESAQPLLQQALDKIDQLESAASQARALSRIAGSYIQLKDEARAQPLLQQALDKIDQLESAASQAYALSRIAEQVAKLPPESAQPLLQQALDKIDQIEDASYQARALSSVAEQVAKLPPESAQPLLQQALDKIDQIEDASDQAETLSSVAEQVAKLPPESAQPLLQQVLDKIDQLEDASDQARALSSVAVSYIQLKDEARAQLLLQQALDKIDQLEGTASQAYALSSVAISYIQLKDEARAQLLLQQALDKIDQLESASDQERPFSRFAEQERALSSVAYQVAKLPPESAQPLLQQALDKIDQLEYFYQARALSSVAGQVAKLPPESAQPLLQQALDKIDQIEDASDQAYALSSVAEQVAKLPPESAQPLLQQVLDKIDQIEDASYQARALSSVAVSYIQLKDEARAQPLLQQALDKIDQIEDASDQAYALSSVAEQVAKLPPESAQPLLQQVLDKIDQIEDASYQAETLSSVAEQVAKLPPESAQPLLQQVLDKIDQLSASYQAYALSSVAEQVAKLPPESAQPLLQQALDKIDQIEDASYQARALSSVAEQVAKLPPESVQPLLQQALDKIDQIEVASYQARALSSVAVRVCTFDQPLPSSYYIHLDSLMFQLPQTGIDHESSQVYAQLVTFYAWLHDWKQANRCLEQAVNHQAEAKVGLYIAWARQPRAWWEYITVSF